MKETYSGSFVIFLPKIQILNLTMRQHPINPNVSIPRNNWPRVFHVKVSQERQTKSHWQPSVTKENEEATEYAPGFWLDCFNNGQRKWDLGGWVLEVSQCWFCIVAAVIEEGGVIDPTAFKSGRDTGMWSANDSEGTALCTATWRALPNLRHVETWECVLPMWVLIEYTCTVHRSNIYRKSNVHDTFICSQYWHY